MKNLLFGAFALVAVSVLFGCEKPNEIELYQQKTKLGYLSPSASGSGQTMSKTDGTATVELDPITSFELEIPGQTSLFATGTASFSFVPQTGVTYTLWGTGTSGTKYDLLVESVDGVANVTRIQVGPKIGFQVGSTGTATNQYGVPTSTVGQYYWFQSKDGLANVSVTLNGITLTQKSFSGFLVLPILGTTMNGTDTLKYVLGPSGQFQKDGIIFDGTFSAVYSAGGISFKPTGTTVAAPIIPGVSYKHYSNGVDSIKIWRNDNAVSYAYTYDYSPLPANPAMGFSPFPLSKDTLRFAVIANPGGKLYVWAAVRNSNNVTSEFRTSFDVPNTGGTGTGTFGSVQIICIDTTNNLSFQSGRYVVNGSVLFGDRSMPLTNSITISAASITGYGVQKDSVIVVPFSSTSTVMAKVTIKWGVKTPSVPSVDPPAPAGNYLRAFTNTYNQTVADSLITVQVGGTNMSAKVKSVGIYITRMVVHGGKAMSQMLVTDLGWKEVGSTGYYFTATVDANGKVKLPKSVAFDGARNLTIVLLDVNDIQISKQTINGLSVTYQNVIENTQNDQWLIIR